MPNINFQYIVRAQVEGCDKWYQGEGTTLAEALHIALYSCGDAKIRTQLVWTLSDEKSSIST